jgi:HEAT repeat protein
MPFQPGQSGNPGGRPKEAGKIKELARKHDEAAINALVEALADSKTRVPAAVALLDRAYGRPAQTIMGDEDNPLRAVVERIERVIVDPADTDTKGL